MNRLYFSFNDIEKASRGVCETSGWRDEGY